MGALQVGESPRISTDSGDRDRIQEALHKSESLLRAIVETAVDGIITIDERGNVLSFNPAAERLFGYTPEEVLGKNVKELMPAPYHAEHDGYLCNYLNSGIRKIIGIGREVVGRRKDGSQFPMDLAVSETLLGDRTIYAGIIRDISERKANEDALRKNEAQLQTIVDNINHAVIVSDLEGNLLHFNRAALEMLEYSTLEDARQQFDTLVDRYELRGLDGAKWPLNDWPLTRILRGEPQHNLEAQMRRISTGRTRIYSFSGAIARDVKGQPRMAVITFSDITDRKEVEATLREGEERFRTMANSIPQLAWIGRADGYIYWYNDRWYEYTGTTAEQMHGAGWQNVHDPRVLPTVLERWATAIESGEPFEMEFPLRGANGLFRDFLMRMQPLKDAEGRVLQWFGTNTDVETLKVAREEIRQLNADLEARVAQRTAQLQTANKELESFSFSVSHDLRAPLRAIDGFSQTLIEDYGSKLDAEGIDSLNRIRVASQRMGHLIDDLLNLSRLTRAEVNRNTVDLSRIASDVVEELRISDPTRTISCSIAPSLLANADPSLLRIVLTNLISNAWKFTTRVSDPSIEFGCIEDEGVNAFFVRDNGAGFNMAYAGKLFGAFQRMHAAQEFPGTGIGLATVQRIIHRHGGKVWAKSTVGIGATFFFTL